MTFKEPTLWGHQKAVVAMSKLVPNLALFHDMGTGKSCTTITILRHKYSEAKRLRKTLILSPLITLQNWKAEFGKFSKIYPGDVVVLAGSGKKRLEILLAAITDENSQYGKNKIIITNYETLQMPAIVKALTIWCPEILVCDESHRLRNHKSKRAKAVASLADRAHHKYLLTGSPILNSIADIFYQYRILDGGKTFGDNFYGFRARYMIDKNATWSGKANYFPKFEPRADMFPEITAKMYAPASDATAKASRVLKKDCLDLPPLVKQVLPVAMGEDQAKMYAEMRGEFITYVENLKKEGQPLAVVAQLAITKALRLQQITSGFVKAHDGQEYEIKDCPRLEALEGLLEEICASNKVIVWACFKYNYKQIAKVCEKLGIKYRAIHGEVSANDKQIAMEEFRKDPEIKVMIANQASAGVGINLIEASYSIYYSRNFSLEQDQQSEARNYRGGSEMHDKITRIDLVAPGTTDELVARALEGKENLADAILSWKL